MPYPTTFGTLPDQQSLGNQYVNIYPTTAALALEQQLIQPGALAATVVPFAMYQAQGTAPTDSQYVTSVSSAQYAGGGGSMYWKQIAGVQRVTQTFTLAQLQALTTATAFNCIPVLPTNAKLLGFDVVINTTLAGNTSDTITVQGSADAAGTIVASTNIFTTQTAPAIGMQGSNPYASRSAQQIQATITGGSALSGLTAGSLTFNAYIAPAL